MGKNKTTTYLEWGDFITLASSLERDKMYQECICICLLCFLGLRISDVLRIRWRDVLGQTHLIIDEQKSARKKTKKRKAKKGKIRHIKINDSLQELLQRTHDYLDKPPVSTCIMSHHWGGRRKMMTQSGICRRLRQSLERYDIPYDETAPVGTHIFRKTFAMKYLADNGENAVSLGKLMKIFKHSSLSATLAYLGITQKDEDEVFDNIEYINPND